MTLYIHWYSFKFRAEAVAGIYFIMMATLLTEVIRF